MIIANNDNVLTEKTDNMYEKYLKSTLNKLVNSNSTEDSLRHAKEFSFYYLISEHVLNPNLKVNLTDEFDLFIEENNLMDKFLKKFYVNSNDAGIIIVNHIHKINDSYNDMCEADPYIRDLAFISYLFNNVTNRKVHALFQSINLILFNYYSVFEKYDPNVIN